MAELQYKNYQKPRSHEFRPHIVQADLQMKLRAILEQAKLTQKVQIRVLYQADSLQDARELLTQVLA